MKKSRKAVRSKAIVAMIFAGGLLNSTLPAVSEESVLLDDAVILQLSNDYSLSSPARAYYLLKLAEAYLDDADRSKTDLQYSQVKQDPTYLWRGRVSAEQGPWERILLPWAQALIRRSSSYVAPKENLALANRAIQDAIKQLDSKSPVDARLHLYFIGELLAKRINDEQTQRICEQKIQSAIGAAEESLDQKKLKATASVLSLMADALVPGDLPVTISEINNEKFLRSEKLKLKALRFIDRLPPSEHARRLAHRDLARWYSRFDKRDLAEEQKQILFELVGISDDRIMDPQSAGCGHFVWWQLPHSQASILCGMG